MCVLTRMRHTPRCDADSVLQAAVSGLTRPASVFVNLCFYGAEVVSFFSIPRLDTVPCSCHRLRPAVVPCSQRKAVQSRVSLPDWLESL